MWLWCSTARLASGRHLATAERAVYRRTISVRAISTFGVVAAALLLPVAAGSEVVPGQSISGVRLGMTQKQVRAKLGTPKRIKHTRPLGEQPAWTYFEYSGYSVAFACDPANCTPRTVKRAPFVRYIWTTTKSERTPSGIGIGATKAQVKARVPGVRCMKAFDTGPWDGVECFVDGRDVRAGTPRTYFLFKKGLVGAIALYYAGDPM
jgi:hypothetical protein